MPEVSYWVLGLSTLPVMQSQQRLVDKNEKAGVLLGTWPPEIKLVRPGQDRGGSWG